MIPAFQRRLNLLVGFPSNGEVASKFAISLCNMITHLMSDPVPGFRDTRVQPMHIQGSILSRARSKLVQTALTQDCTHLLFVDSDQRFPRDTAHRLLQHRKEVVACNIATKQIPASPTARRKSTVSSGGEPVYSDGGATGLEQVWRVGTGVMLVDMRVFRRLGAQVFEIKWVDALQDYQGEDWTFCEHLERDGTRIWVDHDLSKEVGHIGQFDFTHEWIVDSIQVKERPVTAVEVAK